MLVDCLGLVLTLDFALSSQSDVMSYLGSALNSSSSRSGSATVSFCDL
jgi:hypothetical protein